MRPTGVRRPDADGDVGAAVMSQPEQYVCWAAGLSMHARHAHRRAWLLRHNMTGTYKKAYPAKCPSSMKDDEVVKKVSEISFRAKL